jgi:hypothetical protein
MSLHMIRLTLGGVSLLPGSFRRGPPLPSHHRPSFGLQFYLRVDYISFLASISQYASSTSKFFRRHFILFENVAVAAVVEPQFRRTILSHSDTIPSTTTGSPLFARTQVSLKHRRHFVREVGRTPCENLKRIIFDQPSGSNLRSTGGKYFSAKDGRLRPRMLTWQLYNLKAQFYEVGARIILIVFSGSSEKGFTPVVWKG